MKKSRGGQRKHWGEEARVWVWYQDIKRRSGWSDYKLDYEFAWSEAGQAVRDETDHRPRTFEWIRKEARKPKGRDWRWRGMEDLVSAVDRNPLFTGSATLYHSDLWGLVQRLAIDIDYVNGRMTSLLEQYSLERIDPRRHLHLANIITKHGDESVFDRCLHLSLRQMDYVSGIVLVWLLHLQAEPPANWRFRSMLADHADSMLDQFFRLYFPLDLHLTYYTDAIHTLEQSRLDYTSRRSSAGYGFLETMGTWPILPMDMVPTVTAEQLFAIL
jgi:hypothetical protein